jgi:hypothetical protein
MPRYFFDVEDGHRLFDATGFVCDDDTDAIIKAAVLAIGVSLDTPEDDPERRIAIINDAGRATRRAIRLRLSYLIQISRRAWRSPSYSAPEENAVRAIAEGIAHGCQQWLKVRQGPNKATAKFNLGHLVPTANVLSQWAAAGVEDFA